MVEFIKVTAKTPKGETHEYMFMGDLDNVNDQARLIDFMMKCCDDCADRYGVPDDWNATDWHEQTMAMWEAMDSDRTAFDWGFGVYYGC